MSPNQPKTPSRNVRVPDDLWTAAQAKAKSEGLTVSAVIVAALQDYVAAGWSEASGERVEPADGA
ncbi:hypothetical protein ACOACO_17500 [Nocardioides sp. CPCC 205120]|uniref:hypothetical protein n=1 Tax=Nocardioides sp. CPCC 205120 TaxID=3406462 RepID=UPI003B514C4D